MSDFPLRQESAGLRRRFCCFVLLSLPDLLLTCWLLSREGSAVYEVNPLAEWWFRRHGWLGLVGFKTAATLSVVGLTAAISRSRPRAAGGVLLFACAVLAVVVLYSGWLVGFGTAAAERNLAEELGVLRANTGRLDEEIQAQQAYAAASEPFCRDLLARRQKLSRAAAALARSEALRQPRWREQLRKHFPAGSLEESVAGKLIIDTVSRGLPPSPPGQDDYPPQTLELCKGLEDEFRARYGPTPLLAIIRARTAFIWKTPPAAAPGDA
jgi:hypothetical protein